MKSVSHPDRCFLLILFQVIDYKLHPNLPAYLAQQYSSKPFDAIIDNVGNDDTLYTRSPSYLHPNGAFLAGGKMSVIHGTGGFLNLFSALFGFALHKFWPVTLGGTPRKYVFHSGNIDAETMAKLPSLVESGDLTGLVDSVFEMDDAIKVSSYCKWIGTADFVGIRPSCNGQSCREGSGSGAGDVILNLLLVNSPVPSIMPMQSSLIALLLLLLLIFDAGWQGYSDDHRATPV
jgi:hypothetical protein